MWSDWGPYSNCYCDGATESGVRTAKRTCDKVLKIYSNCPLYCPGSDTKLAECDDECCWSSVDGGWSGWGEYSDCKCTAEGAGVKTSYRACDNPPQSCGGARCEKWWRTSRTKECNEECCTRVDGGWSWPKWSSCQCNATTGNNWRSVLFYPCKQLPI